MTPDPTPPAPVPAPPDVPAYVEGCMCRRCDAVARRDVPWTTFIVCPTCGNKRCPHATAHWLACSGSNLPGQPGSDYGPNPPPSLLAPSESDVAIFVPPDVPAGFADEVYRRGYAAGAEAERAKMKPVWDAAKDVVASEATVQRGAYTQRHAQVVGDMTRSVESLAAALAAAGRREGEDEAR